MLFTADMSDVVGKGVRVEVEEEDRREKTDASVLSGEAVYMSAWAARALAPW